MIDFVRTGLFIGLLSTSLACSSSSGDASSATSDAGATDDGGKSHQTAGDGGTGQSADGGSSTGSHGSVTFTINDKTFTSTSVTTKHTGSSIEIDGTMNDGQYDQTISLVFKAADTGSGPCGSTLFGGSRSVTYSETFDDGGQTATDAEYMSAIGAENDPSECTFDIKSASPAAGSASGTLEDSNSLLGGDTAVKDPATFSVTWSGVP